MAETKNPDRVASEDFRGNKYLPRCRDIITTINGGRSSLGAIECLGFLDAARVYLVIAPDLIRSCSPAEATNGQVARVVVKYLEDNPSRLHEPFFILAAEGLRQAFPCKGKSPL